MGKPPILRKGARHKRVSRDVDKHVGERIRFRRLQLNMSQEHLAELLGISFQQIQKYEKGANRVAASRLWDLKKALKLTSMDYFFLGL